MSFIIHDKIIPEEEQIVSEILYESFKKSMNVFIKTKDQGKRIISKSMNSNMGFYAYNENKELVGVIGAELRSRNFLTISFSTLKYEFNLLKAIILYFILKIEPVTIKNDIEVYIKAIAVKNDFRSKGIGKSLINYFTKYYEDLGYTIVSLDVNDSNIRAKALYESLGFQTKKYYKYGLLTKRLGFTGVYHMIKNI